MNNNSIPEVQANSGRGSNLRVNSAATARQQQQQQQQQQEQPWETEFRAVNQELADVRAELREFREQQNRSSGPVIDYVRDNHLNVNILTRLI